MISIKIKKKLHFDKEGFLEVDVNIKRGDFLAITGESGSGKTTFLRILAGLERAEGEIVVGNEIWQTKNKFLPPQKREIGFVFQDYALFNHLNVIENLLYVKKDLGFAKKLLKLAGIESLANRKPSTLSGGQKQRVAIARALMRKPKLLLLDEPFSALDEKRRGTLQDILFNFHKEFNLTTIMVTHSKEEIYKLSNKILILNKGKVIEFGETKKILNIKSDYCIKGKVLEILDLNGSYLAIISIGQNIVKFLISKKEEIKKGDEVMIGFNSFSTNIKVVK